MTNSSVDLIPFLINDFARGKEYYVYTAKKRFKKGANRLCTTLMAAIRALKSDPSSKARKARKLVLIADNYSENKNNTLFGFFSMLILEGWYDEIEVYFGPVGHTHNGGDAQHHIHNVILGNFVSATFIHFVSKYIYAWREELTRPTPCVLDVQYDWDEYLAPCLRKVAGVTNTPKGPVSARGFRWQRGPNGVVEMHWKTKAESGEWYGLAPVAGSPGLVNLRRKPRGIPVVVPPNKNIMEQKHRKQLLGQKVKKHCEHEGTPEAMDWLRQVSKHGVLPIHRRLQEQGALAPGELGTEVEMKCGEVVAKVQHIEATDADSHADFWKSPYAEDERQDEDSQPMRRKHPCVGYKDVPVRRRPTYEGSDAQAVAEGKNDEGADAEASECAIELGGSDSEPARPARPRGKAAQADAADDSESAYEPSESSPSSESESDSDEPLSNLPAVRARQQRTRPPARNANKRRQPEQEREESHDVCAVFGQGTNGQAELWLGIKLACRRAKYTRLQFLDALPDEQGKYVLMGESETMQKDLIVHTFPSVVFVKKAVHKAPRNGQSSRKGKVITVTKEALDAAVLKTLEEKCAAAAEDEAEDEAEAEAEDGAAEAED